MFNFSKLTETKESGSGKALALMNQKGGVGKTTMAFNMAHALAHAGKKVLCIDMDPQFNFTSLFNIELGEDDHHIFHLLINSVRELKALHSKAMLGDVLKRVEISDGKHIDIIPAGQELSGFELTVAGINSPRQMILNKMIHKYNLKAEYDYIVIDGPPTLGLIVVNILCAVDGVLYPFIADSFSHQGLKNIQTVLEDIEDMGMTEVPKILGYIPNLFDGRRKQVHSDFDTITKDLSEARVFEPFANKVQFIKSQASKKSVFDFNSIEFKYLQNQFSEMVATVEKDLQL